MWWTYILLGIYILTCAILITAVLLQPGKADAAALFGGGASQTAFGPRGTMNILGWTTWVSAAIMILLALIFSLPQTLGPSSVIRGGEKPAPIEQPAQPSTPAPAGKSSTGTSSNSGTQQTPAGAKSETGSQPRPDKN